MSFSSENPVAVMIDAESVSADDAQGAVAALSAKFPPLILHAFGDFRRPELQGWCDILDEFDGQALQVTPTAGHENSVHICLTMNVMEILHADRASAVCIFCGSGDFSQLAVRVRKAGLPVFGFGTDLRGHSMAPWFDSWQVIGENNDYVETEFLGHPDAYPSADEADVEDSGGLTSEQPDARHDDELAGFRPIHRPETDSDNGSDEDTQTAVQSDRVTDADIQSAIQSEQFRDHASAIDADEEYTQPRQTDDSLEDIDVMAAIEGKRDCGLAKVRNVPPLSDDNLDGHLPEDATTLLSGFISENLNGNGYALLADVAHAATATDLLVPPEQKSHPDEYLKLLLQNDRRFEITALPVGDIEPDFIRRV